MSNGMTIHDVLSYGPVCASDEELGWLVTVNGSYVNLWVRIPRWMQEDSGPRYENVECASGHPDSDLYKLTGAQMIDRAEECLKRWRDEAMGAPEESGDRCPACLASDHAGECAL